MKLPVHLGLLTAAALVPVVVFSSVALRMLQAEHRAAAVRSIHETTRAASLTVDREIHGAQTALRALATSPALAGRDFQAFHDAASRAAAGIGSWVILYDERGQQLVNTRLPFGSTLPVRTRPEQVVEVLARNAPAVSPLTWGSALRRQTIAVDIPVVLAGGRRYVLSQHFLPEYFNMVFRQGVVPPNWIAGVFDKNGVAIVRSHRAAELVGKPAKDDTLAMILSGREGMLQHQTRDGIEVFDSFARSGLSGWTVVIGAPVAEIEAQARQAIYVAAGGLLAALAFAVVLAGVVARRLVRTIGAAADAAAGLGAAQVPAPAPSCGIDEIDSLHGAIASAGAILAGERAARADSEAERARLLESEQAARALAETQNKAKDQFLAMLGHELRNPLNAISGAISVIELHAANPANPAGGAHARAILRRQSEHLTHIVDDLLDLSRVISGKVLLEKRPMDLAALVGACVDTLHATGRARAHQLLLDAVPVWVDADPTRLEQVVTNLLDNALKYTPAGGQVTVQVGVDGEWAVLRVRDTGVGIAPALLPHVFDVFVQGDNSLERAKGGMGIGLSLVQRLVALHLGAVSARSGGPGTGSEFVVRLPATAHRQAAPAAAPLRHQGRRCQVLLVDDQPDGLEMMTMLLEAHGYSVAQAANGLDGLAAAHSAQPAVAVIDIGLPGISGYELARRLRADPATRPMLLVALTGYGLEEDKRRALEAGFDHHFAKPVNFSELHAVVEAYCQAGAQRQAT
jgi:signal transduction histidine kinase/ActR/RegA family two-component response regulator